MLHRYVRQGDSVRRATNWRTWNEFLKAADAKNLNQQPVQAFDSVPTSESAALTALVENELSADARDKHIRSIATPRILPTENIDEFERRMVFKGNTPELAKFAVMRDVAIQGDAAIASISGAVSCRLFVESNGDWINRADVDTTDATRLRALPNGSAQILWKEAGTNTEVNAIVRLGNPEFVALPGKANGPIVAGSSGTVRIWQNTTTDTGYDISGVLLDWMAGGLDISNDKEVLIGWFPDEQLWRVIGAECEDEAPPIVTRWNGVYQE